MPSKRRLVALSGALVLLVAGAAGAYFLTKQIGDTAIAAVALQPDDADVLRVGAAVYAQHCAACHGAQLEGQPNWRERSPDGLLPAPPHDESGHTWHHPDALLFAITKQGISQVIGQPDYRSIMPAYGGVLSDEEIVAVLSWIKSQWPPEARQHQDRMNEQYRASLSR